MTPYRLDQTSTVLKNVLQQPQVALQNRQVTLLQLQKEAIVRKMFSRVQLRGTSPCSILFPPVWIFTVHKSRYLFIMKNERNIVDVTLV